MANDRKNEMWFDTSRLLYALANGVGIGLAIAAFTWLMADRTGFAVQSPSERLDSLQSEGIVATVRNNSPVGTIVSFVGTETNENWAMCDGSELSRERYRELAALLDKTSLEKSTDPAKIKLPDLRGEFIRGVDGMGTRPPRGIDPGRSIGSWQSSSFEDHNHHVFGGYSVAGDASGFHWDASTNNGMVGGAPYEKPGGGNDRADREDHPHYAGKDARGHFLDRRMLTTSYSGSGRETRPRNIALSYIIKIK